MIIQKVINMLIVALRNEELPFTAYDVNGIRHIAIKWPNGHSFLVSLTEDDEFDVVRDKEVDETFESALNLNPLQHSIVSLAIRRRLETGASTTYNEVARLLGYANPDKSAKGIGRSCGAIWRKGAHPIHGLVLDKDGNRRG